jgi:FkbM family methyltransferase
MSHLALEILKRYSRIAPTERGGYRLARLARRFLSPEQRVGTFETPDGLRLRLDLHTYPDVTMAVGLYELDTYRIMRRYLKEGSWFVDVGANLGYFTLLGAKWVGPGGRVDALEPDPLNRQRLIEHLGENRLEQNVRIHDVAAAAEAGQVELIHPQAAGANHGMASFYKGLAGEGTTYTVSTIRLDELLDGVPDLIKLDIEGAELQAVEGMQKLLRASTPPRLIVEHNHASCAAAGYRPADLFAKLLQLQPHYRIYWIGRRLRQILNPPELDSITRQGNLLVSTDI